MRSSGASILSLARGTALVRGWRPWLWALSATAIVYLWSLLFWYLFFVLLAWEALQIPMGLGGAVYPALFSVPVLVLTAMYEISIAWRGLNSRGSRKRHLLLTLGLPATAVTITLILFCPMDTQMGFLQYVIAQRLSK